MKIHVYIKKTKNKKSGEFLETSLLSAEYGLVAPVIMIFNEFFKK